MNTRTHASRLRGQEGYTLVFVALSLTFLLAGLGLAYDVGYLEYVQRLAQTAADAAAQSGAEEIVRGDPTGVTSAAQNDAMTNGFTNGTNGITVTVNNPPLTGYYAGNPLAVEAIVSQNVNTFFMRFINRNSVTVNARAVASQISAGSCVYALNPSAPDTIQTNNNASVTIGCGVIDNSSSATALYATGSAGITATSISVAGNYATDNNGHFSPTPKIGTIPLSDPLSAVPAPTVGSCTYTNYPNPGILGGQSVTLSPGVYCNGINISNGMTGTFNSGTYIVSGGGLNIGGGVHVTGSGVTFYITSGHGYAFAPINIANGTYVTLSAPTSGTYTGILFFQDRNVTTANTSGSATVLAGGANMALTGAIYLPGTALNISNGTNTSANYTIIVADTITFTGGITLNANYSGLTGGSPIQVATLGE